MMVVFDLSVTLTAPPPGAAPEVLASIALRCAALGLSHSGDLFYSPLSSQERQNLAWYLEAYWQGHYERFWDRGKRLYDVCKDCMMPYMVYWRREAFTHFFVTPLSRGMCTVWL